MNYETLANDIQRASTTKEETAAIVELVAEITPVSVDNYRLVGGGSSIVLFD